LARKIRLFLENTAIHIATKGINQEKIFIDDVDYLFYTYLVQEAAQSTYVSVHAYSLRATQINLLCTFSNKDALSLFMQSLGVKYVQYFNKKYNRNGTIWEGRYRSSHVEDRFVLPVMRYIESFENYSSFKYNVLNEPNDIVKAHEMYELLGKDSKDRASIYKSRFFEKSLKKEDIDFIEDNLNRQTLTGSLEFYKKAEELSGENFQAKTRGRPRKEKDKKISSKLVALDKTRHKQLKISPLEDLKFAKDLSFIPVLANEAALASEMFPIVFTSDKENSTLVALTSLGKGNLAINEKGKYIGKYIPAFLRKYPFSLVNIEGNEKQKAVFIYEEASNISKTKGKQLFTNEGKQSDALKNSITFLIDYEKQQLNTMAIIKTIKDSGILEDREISITQDNEKKVLIDGFQVVNKDKLKKLNDATLALWVRNGIISFIDFHINSLAKTEILFKLTTYNEKTKK